MSFIVWNDRLSVDIASIDHEHKELIRILNDLYSAITRGAVREAVSETLARLTRYTEHHFRHEEELFARTAYPDAETHRLEHLNMVQWLANCQSRYESGRTAGLSLEIVNYVKDWLFDHILGSDHAYSGYLRAEGIQ